MDIDYEEEENQSFSEDDDNELQNQKNEPWQFGLPDPKERLLALYENGNFTDITLTFPGWEVTYDAHRLILAISSPVFEGILYGPMRTEGRNVLLHDDDPLAMEYVIAHCYGYDLDVSDMDMALEVYKLADKYILESLKTYCYQHIVDIMNGYNDTAVIDFSEKFNLTDLKYNCLSLLKEKFKDALFLYESDPDYDSGHCAFRMIMQLSDTWFEGLLPEFGVNVLDFQESWKYPECPLENNRLRAILSSKGWHLDKFYGCINAESVQHFPLASIPRTISRGGSHISDVNEPDPLLRSNDTRYRRYVDNTVDALELCLSVTDLNHARSVIEAINQQNRFEINFIALHIRCEEVWPRNWSPIRPERTHRPSILLISDADDEKSSWIVEASKAFLPQCEGSYNKVFNIHKYNEVKPINILCLPRNKFTPIGFINLLQKLSISGLKFNSIDVQSPNHSFFDNREIIYDSFQSMKHRGFHPGLQLHHMDFNVFRKVFELTPKQYLQD